MSDRKFEIIKNIVLVLLTAFISSVTTYEMMYDNVGNDVLNGLTQMQEIVREQSKNNIKGIYNDSLHQAKFDSIHHHYHMQGVDILKTYIKMNNITE